MTSILCNYGMDIVILLAFGVCTILLKPSGTRSTWLPTSGAMASCAASAPRSPDYEADRSGKLLVGRMMVAIQSVTG